MGWKYTSCPILNLCSLTPESSLPKGMLAELRDNRRGRKHRLRLSDAISCGLFLRDVGYWQREREVANEDDVTDCRRAP